MKNIIINLVKNMNKSMLFLSVCVILLVVSSEKAYALTAQQYDRFVEDGRLGNLNIEVNAKGQMFRKFGHFIIDGQYTGGDENPFYNEENTRDLAVLAVTEDSVYEVYGEIDYDAVDYSYEDDEDLNATEYDRATFKARVLEMDYGNTLKKSTGYGKYNLRPGKNLTAFIKFAYDFYKNNSGEARVGCKNADDLVAHGIDTDKICPMEELEAYASKNYISTDETDDVDLKRIWKNCTEKWEYQGSGLNCTENIFEHLQDIFMCYVYLKPGIDKIRETIGLDTSELSEADYGAILSMMYERFGGRPINPARVESGNAIPVIGTGDVLAALVDLSDTELEYMTIADKIYTCMIEEKYKNNDLKLAGWIKEAEEVNGGHVILTAEEYDIYMKAYQKAFQLYGSDTANDTLLDYGCVLTPDIFESKKSFNEALNDFARTIRNHFGNSSFYNNRDNANYVAKSYVMAKKICENSAFCDITDIYACDMDVVEHTYGYDSSNIILLADTQVVQLNDSYGEDYDTDQDGINDNVEAHTPEEVDITNFLKEYCKYNKYTPEETADMLAKNSKVVMYNYSSNPVLPDSDFDGRDDLRDGRKLDNEYNSTNETDNYSNIKIKFNQDYRYFFMESTQYYEELAEMGLILSNMASKKKNNNNIYVNKKWTNNNIGEHYIANNINDFMWYIGMDQIQNHMEENVPYIIGQHDVIALLGKVNNLERNVITLVIGENENYKDILAANYDGSLGSGSGEDIHHQGYDYHAQQIYEQLVNYDNNQIADRWKKSYWIVGYGTGGSIANLVAKKFIDYKHVNTNVYCYTYQAPNTINRNNLIKRIVNTKYQSIFNMENTDDIMLNLMGDEAGWTKYGVLKRLSVGDNPKVKQSWNSLTGGSYKGGSGFLSNIFNGILDFIGGLVSGFANTQNDILAVEVLDQNMLAMATYAEKIKYQSSALYQTIYSVIGEHSNYITDGANIYTNGQVSLKHSQDMTSMDKVITNNLYTILQPMITRMIEADRAKLRDELLDAVEEMGNWYCANIATYQYYSHDANHRKTKYNNASETAKARFDKYMIDEKGYTNVNKFSNNCEGTKRGSRALYNAKDTTIYDEDYGGIINEDFELNNGKDYIVGNSDYNNNLYRVGDDCSDFASAVFLRVSKGNRGQTKKASETPKAGERGLYLHETNCMMFANDRNQLTRLNNTVKAMEQLGYKLYDIDSNTKLIRGDILITTNDTWKHIEFYVGKQYKIDEDTQEVTDELEDVEVKNGEYKSTFGWGTTHASFPSNSNYFKYVNNHGFRLGTDSTRDYTRFYRRMNNPLNESIVEEMMEDEEEN